MKPRCHFGQAVRQLRENRGWTIRQLAEKVQISTSFLSKVERDPWGQHIPSERVILRLAHVLGQDHDLLLALAGRIATDVQLMIMRKAPGMSDLIRALDDMEPHQVSLLVSWIAEIKENWDKMQQWAARNEGSKPPGMKH